MRPAIITRSVTFAGEIFSPREEGKPTKVELPDEFRTDLPSDVVKFLDEAVPAGVEPMNPPNPTGLRAVVAAAAAASAASAETDKTGALYEPEELEARTVAQLEDLIAQHPSAIDALQGSGANGAIVKADLVAALLTITQ